MDDFEAPACPNCDGELVYMDYGFFCIDCAADFSIRRNGEYIILAPINIKPKRTQPYIDRSGLELTIRRLTEEINELEYQRFFTNSNSKIFTIEFGKGLGVAFLCFTVYIFLESFIPYFKNLGDTLYLTSFSILGLAMLFFIVNGFVKQSEWKKKEFQSIDKEINYRREEIARLKHLLNL